MAKRNLLKDQDRRKLVDIPVDEDSLIRHFSLSLADRLEIELRGLRDRAILLLGFVGGRRRSEIVGLDIVRDDHLDGNHSVGAGWIEIFPDHGVLVTLRGKTGWREVEGGRGTSDQTCPVVALESWIRLGRIARGPLFRRIFKDNKTVDAERLSDKPCRPPGQADRARRRRAFRSSRRRTCVAVLRALAPRRSCFLGRHRPR